MNRYETFKILFEEECRNRNFDSCFNDFLSYCLARIANNFGPPFMLNIVYFSQTVCSNFPRMFRELELFAQEEFNNPMSDMLGKFYEEYHPKKPAFIPFPKAEFIAKKMIRNESYGLFDFCCGSGRVLLAMAKLSKKERIFCGIETNTLFAKMAAINLLLNNQKGEIICVDNKGKFKFGYLLTQEPRNVLMANESELELWDEIRIDVPKLLRRGKV